MILAGTVAAWSPSAAQVAVPTPPATPPTQSLPSRDQVDLPKPQRLQAPPAKVTVEGSRAVPAAPCPLEQYDFQVTIQRIDFAGAGGKALAPEIRALLAPIAATPPSGPAKLAVVCAIRDRATAALRQAGYVASVQIPPQRIEDGVLHLDVVTAHIVDVRVEGDAGPYRKTLAARIARLKALDPLNERDAERILLIANEVPGLQVSLGLRPAGTNPGEVVGDLKIRVQRGAILANAQNYGSKQIGRISGYARAELYGITGSSDLLYIGGQTTSDFREQQVVQAGYATGIGSRGLSLALGGTYAWSKPDLGDLDLRAQTYIANFTLQYPLIREVRLAATAATGMDFIEQRTRVYGSGNGGSPLNRDRIRTAFFRMTGSYHQPTTSGIDAISVAGSIEVRKGLDLFDATKPLVQSNGYSPSRIEGRATATVIRGDLTAVIAAPPILSFAGRVTGQYTRTPLLNYDEYSIGNLSIGRGYDPGANSADRLIGTSGEVRANLLYRPKIRIVAFGFYDSIWIENLDTNAIETNRQLRSYGGGVRFYLPGILIAEATYAHPRDPALLLPGAVRPPNRLMLSITARYGIGGR